jgi:hypothetical protein
MAIEWEQYRERYLSERPETYEAYVDVWVNDPAARRRFTGWASFSQCANAEPAKRRDVPHLVEEAEAFMRRHGYEIGPSTPRGGRRWRRKRGDGSSRAVEPTAPTTSDNDGRGSSIGRPREVECPNDPGMMVPIAGQCICGWSPSDDT